MTITLLPDEEAIESCFQDLPPFDAAPPSQDELDEHVSIFRAGFDFLMNLPPDIAGYSQRWVTQLGRDWHTPDAQFLIRVCTTVPGYADSSPHPHFDPIPGKRKRLPMRESDPIPIRT